MQHYIVIAVLVCLGMSAVAHAEYAQPSAQPTVEGGASTSGSNVPTSSDSTPNASNGNTAEGRVPQTRPSQSRAHRPPRHQWTLGVAVGGTTSPMPTDEKLTDSSGVYPTKKYKFKLTGEGLTAGLTAGYALRRGQMSYGVSAAAYVDTFQIWNRDAKTDLYGGTVSDSATYFKRTSTLEFAGKIGRYIDDIHLYGKLGVVCSAFQYKLKDANADVDAKKNLTAWGGAVGAGAQMPIDLPAIGNTNVGVEYNFYLYDVLTPKINYLTFTNTTKLRPRYHSAYLTLSKPLSF